jgi:hypothetical protein
MEKLSFFLCVALGLSRENGQKRTLEAMDGVAYRLFIFRLYIFP